MKPNVLNSNISTEKEVSTNETITSLIIRDRTKVDMKIISINFIDVLNARPQSRLFALSAAT